jgi:hypothetical protein
MEELIVVRQVQRAYRREFEPRKLFLLSLHCSSVALMIHCLFMDQTTTLSNTWERRQCYVLVHCLPISIVPSAAALQVIDLLEGRRKLAVDNNVVVKNQGLV